jgi:hypothetical protein
MWLLRFSLKVVSNPRGRRDRGGGPPPLAYMCSVHSNSKNYKIVKISLIKLNRAAALAE